LSGQNITITYIIDKNQLYATGLGIDDRYYTKSE